MVDLTRVHDTIRTRIIELHATPWEMPLLVKPCYFSLSSAQAKGISFRYALLPLSKRGNFGRLSEGFIIRVLTLIIPVTSTAEEHT